MKQQLIENLKNDNTIEQLEELGKINIDNIDGDYDYGDYKDYEDDDFLENDCDGCEYYKKRCQGTYSGLCNRI